MKKWRIDGDWSFDGLALVDAEVPDPGPGEVAIPLLLFAEIRQLIAGP